MLLKNISIEPILVIIFKKQINIFYTFKFKKKKHILIILKCFLVTILKNNHINIEND